MQVLAEAGADVGLLAQPADLGRLQFALAIDHAHVDLEAVLVGQEFFDPVVDLQVRTDQDQPVLCVLDQLFQEVIGSAGVEELGQKISFF